METTPLANEVITKPKGFFVFHPAITKDNPIGMNTSMDLEMKHSYLLVMWIDAPSYNDVFAKCQNIEHSNYSKSKIRSTSIGDIVCDLENGKAYMFDSVGCKPLTRDQFTTLTSPSRQ